MKKFVLLMCALITAPLLHAAPAVEMALPTGVVKPSYFDSKEIKVLAYQKGAGGLNVWHVEKDSKKTVFYTTPDNSVLLSGVLWESTTGRNLSDAYITDQMVDQALTVKKEMGQALVAESVATPPGKSKAGVSDAIKHLSALNGIKEGRASIDKTLYIMFDPRCPYCHSVFRKTRAYVKAGGSIKWIPTAVLGDRANGARMIADMMQSRNPVAALEKSFTVKVGSAEPNAETRKTISDNEAYFFAAFDKNSSVGPAGVPVAFFETKAGAPQMVTDIDNGNLLNLILEDIKK